MSNKGGARPGAGRPPGSVNRATAQARARLSELASAYSEAALETLADIARNGESENARVSAATALLDRAYGKPVQAAEVSGPDGGAIETHERGGVTLDVTKLDDTTLDALMAAKRDGGDGGG